MALYIITAVASADSQLLACYTTETSGAWNVSSVTSQIAYSSNEGSENSDIPDIGFTTDQVSTADWEYPAGSGTGVNLKGFRVTSIGSNTAPSISELNSTTLITEYYHSNHANSVVKNGFGLYGSNNPVFVDLSNMTITPPTGAVIGCDQIASTYAPNETIGTYHRTPTNDRGNIYYNGILWNSQTSQQNDQTSTNENNSITYETGIKNTPFTDKKPSRTYGSGLTVSSYVSGIDKSVAVKTMAERKAQLTGKTDDVLDLILQHLGKQTYDEIIERIS